jgi:hypothetical protein
MEHILSQKEKIKPPKEQPLPPSGASKKSRKDMKKPVLYGDISQISIPEVLQLLEVQRQTGLFTIKSKDITVDIYFSDGLIDIAKTKGLEEKFLLGNYFVEEGLISRQELETLFKNQVSQKKLLGTQLIRLNYITESDLHKALLNQTSDIIHEVIRWQEGEFEFRALQKPSDQLRGYSLKLPCSLLLLEGYRRVNKWWLIEKEIEDFDLIFTQNQEMLQRLDQIYLNSNERSVLHFVNGENTVREIIDKVNMSAFEVSAILYHLFKVKLIHKKPREKFRY